MCDFLVFRGGNSLAHARTGILPRIRPAAGTVLLAQPRIRGYADARGADKGVQVTHLDDGSVMFSFDDANLRPKTARTTNDGSSGRRVGTEPSSPKPSRGGSSGRDQHADQKQERRSVSSGCTNKVSTEVGQSRLSRDASSPFAGKYRRRSLSPPTDQRPLLRQQNSPQLENGATPAVQGSTETQTNVSHSSVQLAVAVDERPQSEVSQNGAASPSSAPNRERTTENRQLPSKDELVKKTVKELNVLCKELGLKGYSSMRKAELIDFIASS